MTYLFNILQDGFFAAIAATLCGGGATIGRVAYMHTTGVVVFAGLMGVVINQIISGLCIAGRVHSIPNVYTVGDLCGMYYGRAGRLVSSVVCFLFCLGLFGVQILAMGAILQTATGIDLIPAALISSAITLAYTWAGGMLGVTMTDAIQYVIIVVGVSLCGYLGIAVVVIPFLTVGVYKNRKYMKVHGETFAAAPEESAAPAKKTRPAAPRAAAEAE